MARRGSGALLTIPYGLPAVHTRAVLEARLPECSLSEVEMERLQHRLVHNVCHELGAFLEDDTLRQIANNMGVEYVALCERPWPERRDTTIWQTLGPTVRNALAKGNTDDPILKAIGDLAPDNETRALVWGRRGSDFCTHGQSLSQGGWAN